MRIIFHYCKLARRKPKKELHGTKKGKLQYAFRSSF